MMNSFFSELFLQLQQLIEDAVPEIRYTDQNLGQLAQIGNEDRPPMAYPAVLIDFPNTQYSNISGGQLGNAQVAVLLVMDTYSQTWNGAPADVVQEGLDYLELEHKLVKAIQALSPDFCTPLVRTSIRSQNNNDVGLRVREIMFETEYEDWGNPAEEKEVAISFKGILKEL